MQAQLGAKDATIQQLTTQIETLTKTIAALSASLAATGTNDQPKKNNRRGGGDRPAVKAAAGDDTRPVWLKKMCNQGAYCWTCGFNPVGAGHTSKTCKNKAAGHDDTATVNDRKGGSTANKPSDMTL